MSDHLADIVRHKRAEIARLKNQAEPEVRPSNLFLPIFDPSGKVEQWSRGLLRDPVRRIALGLRSRG